MSGVLRLLAFSDTHGSLARSRRLARRAEAEGVHGVVSAGDFSTFGDRWQEGIAPLVESGRKLLAVAGNHEPVGLMARVVEAFPWVVDLEMSGLRIGELALVGLGAAGYPGEAFEARDPLGQVGALAEALGGRRLVVVSHLPPEGRAGSFEAAFGAWIEARQPELVICGHVHRWEGRELMIGGCRVACVGRTGSVIELPYDGG